MRGALTCGATVGEIEEVLVHVTIYCGTPTGRQSFLAVHEALLSAGQFLPSRSGAGPSAGGRS